MKIIIGIIVEGLSLIPSLLLVQFFRRIRPRREILSPLRQTLYQIKSLSSKYFQYFIFSKKFYFLFFSKKEIKKREGLTFPSWCLFLVYGLCVILVGSSIFLIISRGIEFGDLKSQQWLISILSGFFSSILITQPIKVCFSIEKDFFSQSNFSFEDHLFGDILCIFLSKR